MSFRDPRLEGWAARPTVSEDRLHWSVWIQGYFQLDMSSNDPAKRIWLRNYQELYTRDAMVMALGDIAGRKGLDVAGGAGDYGIVLSLLGAEMSCQDLSEEVISSGRLNAERAGVEIDFRPGDAQLLRFDDGAFDFCISTDFFEHITIDEKRAVIGEISRVLKPGGTLVIKTPNRSYLAWVIRMKRVLAIASLQSPWIFIEHTRDNPDREHHGLTTYRELESLLDERLFVNVERVPLRLRRRRLPAWLSRRLFGFWPLTEHIILRCNHSVFVPLGDSLERRGA
jgi:2-polyprenyl-3-methyl-5-hydroxy-6-metoxy-1,4-benzoquinol methylase